MLPRSCIDDASSWTCELMLYLMAGIYSIAANNANDVGAC